MAPWRENGLGREGEGELSMGQCQRAIQIELERGHKPAQAWGYGCRGVVAIQTVTAATEEEEYGLRGKGGSRQN